jgi:predicted Zn-dependent peptidase
VDVLSDIVCCSRFAGPEIAREKSVVKEEIFQCMDDPDDRVNELFSEQLWGGHGLGRPILGTVETLDALDRDAIYEYFRARFRPDLLVVTATGDVEHDRVLELVTRQFDPPAGDLRALSGEPEPFEPTVRHEVNADLQQLYLSLGTRGVAYGDASRYPLVVLHTLFGGGMSSRLFQSVREEAGLAYSIYSTVDFHRDCGALSIHLGVSPARGRESIALVRKEIDRLREEGPSADEVEGARAQIRGSLMMGQESVSNRMYQIAHDEIYAGQYIEPREQLARVMAVTHDQVVEAARTFLKPERFALTALGPAPGGPLDPRDWEIASTAAA